MASPEPNKKRRLLVISGACIAAAALIVCAIIFLLPPLRYSVAGRAFDEGRYARAGELYAAAGDYRDAPALAETSALAEAYADGEAAFALGDYAGAEGYFNSAGEYLDAAARALESVAAAHYTEGVRLYDEGEFEAAATEFGAAEDYLDAKDRQQRAFADLGDELSGAGEQLAAARAYSTAGMDDSVFACGRALLSAGEYDDAETVFMLVPTADGAAYAALAAGKAAMAGERYADAITCFAEAGSAEDAEELYLEANYMYAGVYLENGDYANTAQYFTAAGEYDGAADGLNACTLLEAEYELGRGYLNTAKALYQSLPNDFTYGSISVSERLALLKKYARYAEMCGKWRATGDCMIYTRQTHDSTGLWYEWYNTYTSPSQYLTVTCVINDDGTVTMAGTVEYTCYTNYSSRSASLDVKRQSVSYSKITSALPNNLQLASNVKLTFSGGVFKMTYVKTVDNVSAYFTYRYTSKYTFGTLVETY